MDLFELWASLGLNTSGFTDNLDKVLKWALRKVIEFGEDVLETGMAFDKEMSAVQAVLGPVEGTIENMIELREFALEQARDSIFTAEQTAEAYYYMGMAGWKTEQMLDGLPGIMALAAASGEDLGMVSDIVTDSLTAFGWSAERASEFADILAQAATNSNTDVRRMGETFKYVAPIAGSLGIEVEDTALAIGLLASQGIKGSMAGTALRNILVRLSTNAGETKKDLGALTILTEKLGVQFYDSSGNVRDFSTVIDEARVAWKGLTQEEQVYYAKQIGSQRGMAAWLALMNAAEEDVNKLKYAFENAEGAAQGMADVKLDNLWGDLQMLNSSLDVLKVAIYDDVKSPLREIVQYATDAIDRIRDAVEENGLVGGIHQLSVEIFNFGEKYKDQIAELASSLVPILETVLVELAPAFVSAFANLAGGAVHGLESGLATYFLDLLSGENEVWNNAKELLGQIGGSVAQGFIDAVKDEFDDGILGQIIKRLFGGNSSDESTIGQRVYQYLTPGISGGIARGIISSIGDSLSDYDLRDEVEMALQDALWSGNETFVIDGLVFDVTQSVDDIVKQLSEAGTEGGEQLGKNLYSAVTPFGDSIGASIADQVGNSGESAGNIFASTMQSALNRAQLVTTVVTQVAGYFRNKSIGGYETITGNDSSILSKDEIIIPRTGASNAVSIPPIYMVVDGQVFARLFAPYLDNERGRVGVKLATGGVY